MSLVFLSYWILYWLDFSVLCFFFFFRKTLVLGVFQYPYPLPLWISSISVIINLSESTSSHVKEHRQCFRSNKVLFMSLDNTTVDHFVRSFSQEIVCRETTVFWLDRRDKGLTKITDWCTELFSVFTDMGWRTMCILKTLIQMMNRDVGVHLVV